jgi:hypothetical protein
LDFKSLGKALGSGARAKKACFDDSRDVVSFKKIRRQKSGHF